MKLSYKSVLAALLLGSALTTSARPAWPGLHKITLQDGTQIECRQVGDEHGHWFVTPDGRALDRDKSGQWQFLPAAEVQKREQLATERHAAFRSQLLAQHSSHTTHNSQPTTHNSKLSTLNSHLNAAPLTDFPTVGEVRGLFILVEFDDVKFQPEYDNALYHRQLNEEGYSEFGGTGSARDYFIAQSYGAFTPRFDVIGPIHLPHSEGYYGANLMDQDGNPGQMVVDACQLAHDSLGVHFDEYDFDNNGEVDFVYILYAGYAENYGAPSSTIWPHMSNLNAQSKYLNLDGKSVNRYACSCELNGKSGTELDGIGAFCHEFGHVLGLPDFYNTYNSQETQLGPWDIMDSGSYNNNSRTPASYTGFERYSLGWLEMVDLTEPADSIVLPEINESGVCYRIPTMTGNDNEYFTLENHQQVGWDEHEPGKGMMIIHIDYNAGLWASNGANSSTYPHYDMEEADGSQGEPRATDVYPTASNDRFTDYSSPNSLSWDETPTEKGVDRIRQEADGNISFRFMLDRLTRPVTHEVTQITDTSFVAVWEPVAGAIGYRIDVQKVLPDSLNPVLLDEDFAKCDEGTYPQADATDISSTLDDYMQTPGWSGVQCYQAGGYLRIGFYGLDGRLRTPSLDTRTLGDDSLTLLYTASSYPGKTVSYDLSLVDAATGVSLKDTTLKANRNMEAHLLTFENVPEKVYFNFETKKERLYFDDLRIASGIHDSLETRELGPLCWTIDSIDVTLDAEGLPAIPQQYAVTGLVPLRTYHYQITALDNEALRSSLPSHDATITTLATGESAIDIIHPDVTSPALPHLLDLSGRIVTSPSRGLYLLNGRKIYIR